MLCERYNRYSVHSLVWQSLVGLTMIVGNILRGKTTIIESECVGRVLSFARGTLPSSLLMTFLYGFGFSYFAMTRLPSVQVFRTFAVPQMGGIFFLYVIPSAIANLVVIRGVVTLTSDIASMRASQELDALEVARFHPAHFVFLPRAMALMIGAPALFVLGVFAAFFGAWCACQFTFRPPLGAFWEQFLFSITSWKGSMALFKVSLTAAIMAYLAGFFGFEGPVMRAETVGKTTTDAVVTATLAITTINILMGLFLD
jgi:phospholipid/cholesterol/gamma-HCH transport system permease protein